MQNRKAGLGRQRAGTEVSSPGQAPGPALTRPQAPWLPAASGSHADPKLWGEMLQGPEAHRGQRGAEHLPQPPPGAHVAWQPPRQVSQV